MRNNFTNLESFWLLISKISRGNHYIRLRLSTGPVSWHTHLWLWTRHLISGFASNSRQILWKRTTRCRKFGADCASPRVANKLARSYWVTTNRFVLNRLYETYLQDLSTNVNSLAIWNFMISKIEGLTTTRHRWERAGPPEPVWYETPFPRVSRAAGHIESQLYAC